MLGAAVIFTFALHFRAPHGEPTPESAVRHVPEATRSIVAPAAGPLHEIQSRGETPDDPPAPPMPQRLAPPWSGPVLAGSPTPGVQVNVTASGQNTLGDAANEPSIAVDPLNPNRIVIGWRQFDSVTSNFREAGWAFSRDAGRTWTFPGVLQDGVFRSDPVLAAGPDGQFYFYSLTSSANFLCDLFISLDGGQTWSPPNAAYGGDKAWIAVDRGGSIGHGNIYANWSDQQSCCSTNLFTRSTNGGYVFMPPVPPTPLRWGTNDVDADGRVFLSGVVSSTAFRVMRSSNARDPNATPFFEQGATIDMGGALRLGGSVNPVGLIGQCWLRVNRSIGPYRGDVYLLASVDPTSNDPADIRFTRSTDGGHAFVATVRVNDDPLDNGAWQWFGTMSVAPNGRIDAIWNDTRNDPTPATPTFSELFYSYSLDGGRTWSANVAISPPFNHTLGYPNQNKIGDYYDMVSDDVGINIAYAATFNGEQDIWFKRLGDYDCNGNGVGDALDIASGAATDFNHNGIPDYCEALGDLNCDGVLNNFDIDPFVIALTDPAGYAVLYPNCDRNRADIDADGVVDNFEIDKFVTLLLGQ